MNGDSQSKGYSRWNEGPETEPQKYLLYHGQGGAPIYALQSNPMDWLITLTQCIPFFNLKTGQADQPIDQAVANDLAGYVGDQQAEGLPSDVGSVWTSDPAYGYGPANSGPDFSGSLPAPGGIYAPMGTINSRSVPLWGSRKTFNQALADVPRGAPPGVYVSGHREIG